MREKSKQETVLDWLISGELQFVELVQSYVFYLKKQDEEQRYMIAGLSIPLIQYWQSCHVKPKKQDVFIRGKAAFYLLKTKLFHGAPIELELENEATKEST